MFAHFTFDSRRSPSLDSTGNSTSTREPSRSVSPCSPTTPYHELPRLSVNTLTAHFADSRIRQDSQICYDSCEPYAAVDDDAGWRLEPLAAADDPQCDTSSTRPRLLPRPSHSLSRRIDRQSQTRLLCSMTHHKDIAALLSRMVDCKAQCSVSVAEVQVGEDDEGYDSTDAMTPPDSRRSSIATQRMRLEYRRSSDMKTNTACVNKAVRFRKGRKHGQIRTTESES